PTLVTVYCAVLWTNLKMIFNCLQTYLSTCFCPCSLWKPTYSEASTIQRTISYSCAWKCC
ncbi:hypothetical protein LTS12_026619, partial [Elasticomyces elasticus]